MLTHISIYRSLERNAMVANRRVGEKPRAASDLDASSNDSANVSRAPAPHLTSRAREGELTTISNDRGQSIAMTLGPNDFC